MTFQNLDSAYHKSEEVLIYNEDVLSALKKLPDECVNMTMTSVPYWALRDYHLPAQIWDGDKNCQHEWKTEITKRPNQSGGKGNMQDGNIGSFVVDYNKRETKSDFCSKCNAWQGTLGLEPTFELYIKHLCDIYDEVKRVLRKDGSCFVNIGDTYFGSGGSAGHTPETKNLGRKTFEYGAYPTGSLARQRQDKNKYGGKSGHHCLRGRGFDNYPSKCMCLIPFRFAISMVERGWILRNVIVWAKQVLIKKQNKTIGSVMPTSKKDAFNQSFEYLFFFTKSNSAQFYKNKVTGEVSTSKPKKEDGKEGIDWEWAIRKGKQTKVTLWKSCDYYSDLDSVRIAHNLFNNKEFPNETEYRKYIHSLKDYNLDGTYKTQKWAYCTSPKFNYRVRDAQRKSSQCPQFKATKEEIKNYKQVAEDYGKKKLQNLPDKGKTLNRWMSGTPNYTYQGKSSNLSKDQAEMFNSPRARNLRQKEAKQMGFHTFYSHSKRFKPGEYQPNKVKFDISQRQEELVKGGAIASTQRTRGFFDTFGGLNNPQGKNLPTCWQINPQPHNFSKEFKCSVDHFASYPCSLVEIPIKFATKKNDIVLDPFAGSGTTGVVAKKLGRKFIGIELNQDYCSKIMLPRLEKIEKELFI